MAAWTRCVRHAAGAGRGRHWMMTGHRLRLTTLLVLAACSPNPGSTTDPAVPGTTAKHAAPEASVTTAICKTDAEVRTAFGTTCTVIGTYELEDITNAKGGVMASWPVVRLDDGRAVMIDSVWETSTRPDNATIERYRGKKVAGNGSGV